MSLDNQRRIQNPAKHLRWGFLQKIVDCIQPLAIFAKHLILGVSQGYKITSDKANQIPGALSLIPQKIRTVISPNFFRF